MKLAVLALPILLSTAPALAHGHGGGEDETFTWCIAEGSDERGKVRYFSEPFDGPTDQWIELSFQQYLEQHYLKKSHNFKVTCKTFNGMTETRAELDKAKTPVKDTTDLGTGWRDHFE
jgi:hypothetical protein